MPTLLAAWMVDQAVSGSFLAVLVHDLLPIVALTGGVMAAIWIVCTLLVISAYLIGALIVFDLRARVRACARHLRRRQGAEFTQFITVDADDTHTKVVNLDRYRRRRQRRRSADARTDDTFRCRCDDDPA
ncbi:hypothetical protein SAMN05421805_10669 [Saccharopolyspora antimicrobica]|uniref:Uncharacterized protein n=1 Tax=Saccharopolyspora antimicrobica TaxID=455193 RepID=A0A1I5B0D0_9PSEU|nr:hypothetical protein [Saccharopolyspora antimicrobica]RKT86428.1 hypothetical protein ATL45_4796 [Saccharopolyspora antimicrobica]SFN68175.1 hypothetical protein SAMN05421805_10669 [Saccharopolyspora antimicrobica]